MRRLVDILVSIGVFGLTAPLFAAAGLLIKLEDRGPVFYRAWRIGKDFVPFQMFKFRSMVVNADRIGGSSTASDDARLTRTGKWLRKYKLDELPQFINVLIGDMHLVGPRPEVKKYVDRYSPEERQILSVRPGITDWATIWNADEGSVLAGSPDPDRAFEETIQPTKLKLQLYYVRTRSMRGDGTIIWYTIRRLIDGAFIPQNIVVECGALARLTPSRGSK